MKPCTWTSCSDKMPPKEGQYIIYAPSADPKRPLMAMAWYDENFGWSLVPNVWRRAITHWMKLPSEPGIVKRKEVSRMGKCKKGGGKKK